MTLTDFLDSLSIVHDATIDSAWISLILGILMAIFAVASLCFAVYLVYISHHGGFNWTIWIGIIAVLGIGVVCTFCAIHSFSLPALSLQWIVRTDSVDIPTLYAYFDVKAAPINGTVEISPKEEFYQEILAWYTTNFLK